MRNKNQILAALGPVGQAVQQIIGGNVEENAATIFDILSNHPHYSADRAAIAVRAKIRRENGGRVYSGMFGGRRVARLAAGAAVGGDALDAQIEEIDAVGDPALIIEAWAVAEFAKSGRGRDIADRAFLLLQKLDALETTDINVLAAQFGVCRRRVFQVKATAIAALKSDLQRLKTHYLAALDGSGDANLDVREAVQAEIFEIEGV